MHPDNKLTNHGKTSDSQSQIPHVNQQQQQQQGTAGNLGSKVVGTGSHGLKANQMSLGNPGLKSVSQSVSSVGGMLKTKSKRERSVSIEPGEPRDAITPVLELDSKGEGVMRSKRRCVLEKKQPYSGDEWCSGPDTEEEEDKPLAAARRERGLSGPIQGLSGPSAAGPVSEAPTPAMGRASGPGHRSDVPQRPSQQVVYVFTTGLANSAAEAVMHGHTESILQFHQQNVPRTKLEQCPPPAKHPRLLDRMGSSSTPPIGTPKSQSGTPRPASVGGGIGGSHLQSGGTMSSAGHPDGPGSAGSSNNISAIPHKQPGGSCPPCGPGSGLGGGDGHCPPTPHAGGSPSSAGSPSVLSAHLQGQRLVGGPGGGSSAADGLSKEQLEHRERSLQTLRDIERLLLRSGAAAAAAAAGGVPGGEPGGPHNNNNNNPANINNNTNGDGNDGALNEDDAGVGGGTGGGNGNGKGRNSVCLPPDAMPPMGMKKYEEPLQSIISQTQNLGGPGMDDGPPIGGPHQHGLPPHPHHHHLSSPGLDMGPMLGPDGLTPEQVAWRKLQEEYYQEKRRQQEIHPQHFRMMSEMGGMQGGPPMMMRGPPPPYHSKPGGEQAWGGPMMGGGGGGGGGGVGMGGNARMMDMMHQEGPRGPRFLEQMQRGPAGGGGGMFPGSPVGVEGLGPQRGPRPGMMVWIDDMPPNMGGGGGGSGGGPFHGCFPPGGPGGPPPQHHLQGGDPDRLLTREEMFRIMEKRQLQGLHRLEMERILKQQQQQQQQQQQGGMGPRMMMDNPGVFMGRGPPSRGGDPMDFPGSREMMGSPGGGAGGGGPQMRDLVDSPLNMNMHMSSQQLQNLQQQQQQQQQQQHHHMMLAQKLRGGGGGHGGNGGGPFGDMLSPEDISRLRAAQNGRGGNKGMILGPDGPLQFPNQGPFPGGQGDGGYLGHHEMFGPDHPQGHMGGTARLSHMPIGGGGGNRGGDMGPRHPSDLSINVNPMVSPVAMPPPPHQLKSPSLSQAPSPLLPSPSAAGLKSPSQMSSAGPAHPPCPQASGAGTPSSSSMKSPQVMGSSGLGLRSPSASPGRLKSPAMPSASPSWAPSPKTAAPSPGGQVSGKGVGNGGSSSTETGPSLPPRSSNSTPISQPGSMNPSMPFTASPDAPPPTQNPLSLIMSQMSKYAMPSSTPLYHDAIKTIATSDDEMLPDRPLLSGVNIGGGNMGNHQNQMLLSQGSMGPHSGPQSPMGMVIHGHDQSGQMLSSPNPMTISGMNPAMMGSGGPPDGMGGPCNVSPMHPQNQQHMSGGFPRMQHPGPHGSMHSPLGLQQQFSQANEDILPPQQLHLLSKGLSHQRGGPHALHPSDPSFSSMPMGDGPDLSEVIRTSHTGIPEFDLSRIMPSDKPSSTLQYFPKSEPQQQQSLHQGQPSGQPTTQQLLKQLSASSGPPHSAPSSNPHLANLQNMMAEQQLPPHCGMRQGLGGMPQGGPRGMGLRGGGGMGPMCTPGHMMGRTGMGPQQHQQLQQHHHHQQQQQQQAMMANSLLHHPSHPHPGMMSPQQHPHNLMAPQNIMMMQAKQRGMSLQGDPFGPQGPLMSPQGGPMMGGPQSGMLGPQSLRPRGMPLDYGPGGMANMPF